MKPWEFYLDESYNDDRTLCIGGFLAPRDMWDVIIRSLQGRLNYENRRSTKKGFPEIRRYHATDVEGGNKEFAIKKGWPARPAKAAQSSGAAANGQKTGHRKYDPRTDPNYTYTVGALDMAWDVHATPKKPGLMGFYIWSRGLGGATTFIIRAGPRARLTGSSTARRWKATRSRLSRADILDVQIEIAAALGQVCFAM